MYVTRPISMYRNSPVALSQPPPEGPYSGILVIQDEDADDTVCCFGSCNNIKALPFPQNKMLEIRYRTGVYPVTTLHFYNVAFIPVLDQPLSSSRYYVIKPNGKHKGEAYMSSNKDDMDTCCFFNSIDDLEPQRFDPSDIYQQFEILISRANSNIGRSFTAKSVAPDGIPPNFLREKGWKVSTIPLDFELDEAPGINENLRARLPAFELQLSMKKSVPVEVGKWYCPSIFVQEEFLKAMLSRSIYYKMTLEQSWELIFSCENGAIPSNYVNVEVIVEREKILVAGKENLPHEGNVSEGVMWFNSLGNEEGVGLGLSMAIIERMKWEQKRVGWIGGIDNKVKVKRMEEFGGTVQWKKFGLYILVERYVMRRMDGSSVLTYEFKHTHQLRGKWE